MSKRRPHTESLERDISFDLLESLETEGRPAARPDADGRRTFYRSARLLLLNATDLFQTRFPILSVIWKLGTFPTLGHVKSLSLSVFLSCHWNGDIKEKKKKRVETFEMHLQREKFNGHIKIRKLGI